jgi:hypothetical protein
MSVKHEHSGLILKSDPDTVQQSNFFPTIFLLQLSLGAHIARVVASFNINHTNIQGLNIFFFFGPKAQIVPRPPRRGF